MDFREFSKKYNDYLMHYGVKGMKWHDHIYKNEDASDDRKDKERKDPRNPQPHYVGPSEDEKIKIPSSRNESIAEWVNMYRNWGKSDDEIKQIFLNEANKPDQTPYGRKYWTYMAQMINKVPRKK